MAQSSSTDRRFLELHHGKWRVVVSVPRDLHSTLGTKLKQSLGTDSLAAANQLKWPVVARFKGSIEAARKEAGKDPVMQEARKILRERRETTDPAELSQLDDGMMVRIDQIRGSPVQPGEEAKMLDLGPSYDPQKEETARRYYGIASGRDVPVDEDHPDYLKQLTVKPRTRADDERAMRYLLHWCRDHRVSPTIPAITRKVAVRFMDALPDVADGRSPATLNKYLSRLSRYWHWLLQRELAETNPWSGLKVTGPPTPHDEEERPFTQAEMVALLSGPASPAMHDLMRIAALTGARLDVIVSLKVRDCADDCFLFQPQKKEKQPRKVPIHSALKARIAARTEGKDEDDDLFPEWPPPKKAGSKRERSFKASNHFMDYRRAVGVDEKVPGKRRSLVNFHSFRRWFVTEAERAGQPESIIAAVVGHKRPGMTLGRYSGGPSLEQARRCVEAVRLPCA